MTCFSLLHKNTARQERRLAMSIISPLGLHRKNQKVPRRFPSFLKTGPTFLDNKCTRIGDVRVYFTPCATCPMFMLMQNAQNERTVTTPKRRFFLFCCRVSRVVLESASPSRLPKKMKNQKKQRALHFSKVFSEIAKSD